MENTSSKIYRFDTGFTQKDILGLRESVSSQLKGVGIGPEASYGLVNVLDEFCCNVMEYSAAHWIEVEVFAGSGRIGAVLKDDGTAFDPTEAVKLVDPEQAALATERRLGLYMVSRLTKDLKYSREDGVNRLEFNLK